MNGATCGKWSAAERSHRQNASLYNSECTVFCFFFLIAFALPARQEAGAKTSCSEKSAIYNVMMFLQKLIPNKTAGGCKHRAQYVPFLENYNLRFVAADL